MKERVLPENILKCMSAKDRKAIGQCTAAEAMAKWEAKNEKDLEKEVKQLLDLKDIVVFYQRSDKRTRGRCGQPDLIFAINGQAYAWELKTPTGKLSLEQERMLDRMVNKPNGWNCSVIRSLSEAIKFLAEREL